MKPSPPTGSAARPRYFYTVVSVALVLFLVGLFGMVLVQGRTLVRLAKESVDLMVELKPGTTPAVRVAIVQRIEAHPATKSGSVRVITREEAAAMMREELGAELTTLGLDNPFFDVVSFNVREAYLGADSLAALQTRFRQLNGVNDLFYQKSLVGEVSRNLRRIAWVGGILGLLLLAVALLLIHNTVRLALHSNRQLIRSMQLVGASWGFITRPYLWRGVWNGLLSGVLAILLLVAVLWGLSRQLNGVAALYDYIALGLLFLGLLLLGILVNAISTYTVVRRYLHLRGAEAY